MCSAQADVRLVPILHETGDIASWPRQAVDKPGADRIGGNREHDRDVVDLLQGGQTRNA